MDCDGCDTRKRSMDRRRETSRCAARERRGKESDVFSDLRDVVPLVEESSVGHLDRIALLRVAATVCRFRCEAAGVLETFVVPDPSANAVKVWSEDTMTETLDGFIIICDCDGNVLYITESVALYLGLTQTDISGRSLKEFFHSDDYNEYRETVGELVTRYSDEAWGRSVVFRMKTVISPRGRNLNMKSALYKPVSFVIRCRRSDVGHVIMMQGVCVPAGQGSVNANATALTKGSDTPSGAYMTRHTCDMRISFISERFNYILKNDLKSLVGTSFYDLVHPADCEIVSKAMKELFTKGHVRTPYYRLLASNGNLAWLMTEANTTSHTCKGQKGQYVVCVHFIVGVQEPCEPLVVCTDAAPAGLPVEIKKEVDDIRDYIGRQPEVIEADNYVPLFTDDNFTVSETLRPMEGDVASAPRQDCFDEVFDWLLSEKSASPGPQQGQQQQCNPTDDPTLASAQIVSAPLGSRCENAFVYRSPLVGGGAIVSGGSAGTVPQQRERYQSAGRDAPYVAFTGAGSMASSTTTSSPSCTSAVHSPDNNHVPTSDARGPQTMYAAMPVANPSDRAACPVMDESQQPYLNPIIEDLQWEEPDLTGLAPFVPDDDVIDFGASEGLPKDLEILFSDLPEWTPAQPLVPPGPPPMMSRVKYEPAAFVPTYINQTPQDRTMGVDPAMYGRQQDCRNQPQNQQEQYWQPAPSNWTSPPNNYTY